MTTAKDIPFTKPSQGTSKRTFTAHDQSFKWELLPAGIIFDLDRVRRSSHELWGELIVRVNGSFPDAKSFEDGIIGWGDLNLSSVQARSTRAKFLAERSGDKDFDWLGLVEEFATKVIASEREGVPDINLQSVIKPKADRMLNYDGIQIPLHHPMVLFGDGGTAKSYLALYWAGRMVRQGYRVLYADWEFTPEEHRERLELLYGADFPPVRYLACYRAFRDERERIARSMRNHGINYLICDSVGLACGGDPCSSEFCTLYFQSLRQLGPIGSLHIAHVTKGSMGKPDDQKPFGSAYWHNMARVSYNIKGDRINASKLQVGLYQRKHNLRGCGADVSYTLQFDDDRTTVQPAELRDNATLTEGLPLGDRIVAAVEDSSKTRKELATLLDADYGTLQRAVHREVKRGRLVEFPGSKRGQERLGLP